MGTAAAKENLDRHLLHDQFLHIVQQERTFLCKLAAMQLRDQQIAEDVVQEAILAGWSSLEQFRNESSLRTWLIGILRFKILDAMRQRKTDSVLEQADIDLELQSVGGEELFDDQGRWAEQPQAWGQLQTGPDEALAQKQLMSFLQRCLEKLPTQTAHILLMREFLGFDASEIAAQKGLQAGNVRIVLMRARLALRTCLDVKLGHNARSTN